MTFIFLFMLVIVGLAFCFKYLHSASSPDVTNEPLDNLKRFLLIEGQIKSLANTIANVQSKQQEINKAILALTELYKQSERDYRELFFKLDQLENGGE